MGVFDGVVLAARALSREVKLLTYVVGHRFTVHEGGAGDVLDGQSDAFEDRYFVAGGASGGVAVDDIAEVSGDVGPGVVAVFDRYLEVAGFGHAGIELVADDAGTLDAGRVELADAGSVGADGVDVCAGLPPVGVDDGVCGGGGEGDDVGFAAQGFGARGELDVQSGGLGYPIGELAARGVVVEREREDCIDVAGFGDGDCLLAGLNAGAEDAADFGVGVGPCDGLRRRRRRRFALR